MAERDPQPLSVALAQLIAMRGYARKQSINDLSQAWRISAGDEVASQTRAEKVVRGTLQVAVDNTPLYSELSAFLGAEILKALQEKAPQFKIKKLKFYLQGLR